MIGGCGLRLMPMCRIDAMPHCSWLLLTMIWRRCPVEQPWHNGNK